MAGQQAQSVASDWFASWFGQCCKGPPTEGELTFEDAKGKKKASKGSQGPSTPAGARKKSGATKRYLIDNSVLQSKTRPGVAFRHCKDESKKVKEMKAVPWGETVDGTDEGDGWLKVGSYYLPMTHQGKPIVTLVEEDASPLAKAKREASLDRKPATPQGKASRKPQSPNGSPIIGNTEQSVADFSLRPEPPASSAESTAGGTSPPRVVVQKESTTSPKKDVVAEPEKPAAPAAQESDSSQMKDMIAEPEKSEVHPAEDRANSPKKDVPFAAPEQPQVLAEEGVSSAGAGLDEFKKVGSFAEDQSEDALVKLVEQPQRAWFVQPSVGTWLHTLPRLDAEEAECPIVRDRPIHISAPPAKWEHLPSVGTWVHRRSVGIAAHPKVELDNLLQ